MAKNKGSTSKKSLNKQIGDYGEKIAQNYLKSQGFTILDTNYTKKCGELDIVAKNKGIVHFVEVKTLSYESKATLQQALEADSWRPEEQVHQFKLHQISKTLEVWLLERGWEGDFQIDVAAVRIVIPEKYATVKYIPNIIAD